MVWREQGNPRYIILVDFTRIGDFTWLLYDCEEQSKDSFYCEFVLQSIINKFATYWVWQGGGVAYLNEVDKTLFLYVR